MEKPSERIGQIYQEGNECTYCGRLEPYHGHSQLMTWDEAIIAYLDEQYKVSHVNQPETKLTTELSERLITEIEGMKRFSISPGSAAQMNLSSEQLQEIGQTFVDRDHGYNQALEDVVKLIKGKYL